MKYTFLAITLFAYGVGFSQDLIPAAVTQTMSQGTQPGISVFIPNVSDDNVEDAIKDVTKQYKGKVRKIKRSDENYIDNAQIKEISPNSIDIHQVVEKIDNGYKYTAFFNLGGKFLDSAYSSEKFAYATSVVRKIAMKASELNMDEVIKDQNKVYSKLEDSKKDLIKENEKAAKDIEKAKDLIAKKENEIEDNLKMMESRASDIEKQRQRVIEYQNQRSAYTR
ncbi:hypothetical protein [Flavobacterium algicola]|uniref:hypothetical protein n=1 Tax=Flavobacterium algicola TaxID=556529 RepID=UPI001EFCEF1B|nr:hypothetical protein [Flavobacterium algicola]MCG9791947.1 hypothetical protein [Flavobacterium algicola]